MKLLYASFFAHFYDLAMRKVERLCLNSWRRELLSGLSGDVLEIGAGTGVNLQYYSKNISRLILCEPNSSMRKQLKFKLQKEGQRPAEIRSCVAEQLDVADCSIDFLVSTLVLCSVSDQKRSIQEAFRVLKPGGKLVFMEHVAAEKRTLLHFWQGFWQPLWKIFSCNCHLTRETGILMEDAGFTSCFREEKMIGAPKLVTPMIVGYGVRP